MKAKRLLFLVMAICLASGVKAQFYDSADDIYYYVEYKNGEYKSDGDVMIFNFDGQKACVWKTSVRTVKSNLQESPSFYEDKVEITEYELKYRSSNIYMEGEDAENKSHKKYIFSSDRSALTYINHYGMPHFDVPPLQINPNPYELGRETGKWITIWHNDKTTYKRVDKSFFKVGRSRTPNNTMHE